MYHKVLSTLAALMFTASTFAAVTITENPAGTVTIAVSGDAGQIGTYTGGWPAYSYSTSFTDANKAAINNATKLVVTGNINSTDIKTLVDQNRNGNTWTINTLDLGGATMSTIKVEASNAWSITSHDFLPQTYYNIACTNFTAPVVADGILPAYFGSCFTGVLATVTLPTGYTSIGNYAFNGKQSLTTVKLPSGVKSIGDGAFYLTALSNINFPNSLETIGNEAFKQTKLTTVVIPQNLKSIGAGAFTLTYLYDVYFLGLEAPVVASDSFDDATYKGNGGFSPTDYSAAEPIGDTDNGYAERRNYVNGGNVFGMMHLRSDLTNEQRAKYTDITRNYEVIKDPTSNAYRAFNDLYYGSQIVWPGQYSYEHTYNDAVNGVLWDGVTTYDKAKYMGLHKFTLTASNVNFTDTETWTFGKKGQNWWTICLPFNMTKAQIDATFGPNTEVCRLSAVIRNKEQKRITLKFQNDVYANATTDDAIVIEAHQAYMIYPTVSATTNIQFSGFQVVSGSPLPTIVKATNEGNVTNDHSYTYRFIGNYLTHWEQSVNNGVAQAITMPQYSYFLGAQGDKHVFFYQTGASGKWNPYTATVQAFDNDTSTGQKFAGEDDSFIFSSGAKMSSLFGRFANETTAVESIQTNKSVQPSTQAVYNLHGQLVSLDASELNNLPAGIYLVNGKKYIVR